MARYSADTVATTYGFRRLADTWTTDTWTTDTSQAGANSWSFSSDALFDANWSSFDGDDGSALAPSAATASGASAAGAGPEITAVSGQTGALTNVTVTAALGGSVAYSPSDPFDATSADVRAAVDATNLAVTGAGITVGVLSDSFNDLGGAAQDEADGALPPAADIDVIKDLGSGGTDEGRAMMQIVHDIAPGANLDFYTADVSEQDFANGILSLAAAGCKVICDDVTYFDEPFFQTGVVANAIQTVEQEGVIFVTAAGNNAEDGYQAAWNPIATTTFDGKVLHDAQNFGNGSAVETVTIGGSANADTVPFVFQWNQPYGSVTSDLEVLVFSGGKLLGTVTNTSSDEATNPIIAFGLSSGFTYEMAIENLSGPNPGLIGEMAEGDGLPVSINVADSGTVQGHHMSTDAITVGAVDSGNTPAFSNALQSESYSSSGVDTQLWFNFNGSAVTNGPLDLSPVALSGVDDVSTSVSGDLSDFFGTSAATPSVAAVVALMLQENPNLTFAQVEQILEQTATPFGSSEVAGAGLVDAAAAVQLAGQIGGQPSSPPVVTTGSPDVVYAAAGPAVVLDGTLTITDQQSFTLVGATVQITGGTFAGDGDVLATDVAGTAISESYVAASETLVLSGADTLADYEAVLRLLTFTSTSGDPTDSGAEATRTVSWVVNDGTASSSVVTTTLNIVTASNSSTVAWANGVSGSFAAAGNWNPSIVPNTNDDVLINASGTYTVSSTASETIDSVSLAFDATLDIADGTFTVTDGLQSSSISGTMLAGSGASLVLEGTASDSGAIEALGGTIDIAGAFSDSGVLDVGQNGAVVLLSGSIAGSITFIGTGGDLVLHDAGLDGQILGAVVGDSIDAAFTSFVAGEHAVWQQTGSSGGTLSLFDDGADLASFTLAGQFNSLDFSLSNDGGGGTLVTVQGTPIYPANAGNTDEWILSNGQWVESAAPGVHPSGYNVAGIGDWTGDGTDGVLWFNPTTGDTDEWQLADTQWSASVDLGTHPGDYQIAGIGDFFGGAIDDVLWTSAAGNGTVATDIWELGSDGQWTASVDPGSHPAGYAIAGTGDWTGNGTDGILWYDASTGDTDEWQLDAGEWSASVDLGSHPGNFQIAGIGDFFDNGRDDVLWTSVNGNGTIATDIWELGTNGQWIASVSPGTHPAGYQVVAVGDFTGTGTSDILWQNPVTGDVDEWLIDNGQWAGSIDLGTHPGNFQIAGVGDLNGQGNAGIFWRATS